MDTAPWPLAVGLLISYVAMLLMISTTLRINRLGIETTRTLLWAVIGLGVLSIGMRTAYFLL